MTEYHPGHPEEQPSTRAEGHGPELGDSGLVTTTTPSPVAGDPIPDPGLPPHEERPTDVDEHMERRAERQVATLFGLSSLFAVLFVVAYFVFHVGSQDTFVFGYSVSHISLGVSLGLALLLLGIGAIQWARKLMSDIEIVEERHPAASSEEARADTLAAFRQGIADAGIARRPLIRNSLVGALALIGVPFIVTLRDLGPLPEKKLDHTVWRRGMRVVNDISGAPMKPEDLQIGQLVNAEPAIFFEEHNGVPVYEGTALLDAKAKAAAIVVRMKPTDITPAPGRENWGIGGILCYSKICTHVGCPISLWEHQTHHLLCPCHQSTFDLADNGKVIFGPAARPLPQLPLGLDAEGYIIAMSDFPEPVGPSFWERSS